MTANKCCSQPSPQPEERIKGEEMEFKKRCPRCGSHDLELVISRGGANADAYFCHECWASFDLYENGVER